MAVTAPAAVTVVLLLVSAGCLTTKSSGVTSATGTSSGGSGTSSGTGNGGSSTGPAGCNANDQCLSGVCGVDGSGNCCDAACATENPICAATGCDETGACLYPVAGFVCDDLACSGDSLSVPLCDGLGNCVPTVTGSCAPFACDAGCLTSCQTTAECAGGFFCDALNAVCCSGLAAGGTIAADSQRGNDGNACCGIGKNQPCQTITQSMKLIDSAQARDVTIQAEVFFDGGLWDQDRTETYPIILGWGAELKAPGAVFWVLVDAGTPSSPAEIFDIRSYSPSDRIGYASIAGAPGLPIALDTNQTAIQVETGSHLYLANADLFSGNGIYLLPLAGLTFGQNRSGSVTGTVTIGVTDPVEEGSSSGEIGLLCSTDDAGNGCTIDDASLDGGSSVIIQNQHFADIYAEDGASISLTSTPIIGVAPRATGFLQCPSKLDVSDVPRTYPLAAVHLLGKASMVFANGAVQCIQQIGFEVEPSLIGLPSLTIENSVIQNTLEGIVAEGGSVTVASSEIRFNAFGVEVFEDAGVDLSGGQLGGVNTIACNLGEEDEIGGGISVLDEGFNVVNANNVAWDTPDPNVFSWTEDAGWTCSVGDCVVLGDAGIVTDVGISPGGGWPAGVSPKGVTTTGHTLSPLQCE